MYLPKRKSGFFIFGKKVSPALWPRKTARLSKGKMIGVRYNKDSEWVGGTLAYFEQ